MSTFRWGIIGTGGIAQSFAEDLKRLDGHIVSAVGSRSLTSAEKFTEQFPGAVPYGSYEELVTADVDAIYVATPHPMHHENALLAMRAGKPVLCEKAFTVNAKEARALVDYAQANRIPLMEAMWSRFLPHMQKVKELVSDGALGEITNIVADHGQYIPYERAPRLWEPELGGGALLDLGIYPLTLAHLILGSPISIHAEATLTDKKVDLNTSMVLRYANGAHALLSCTMASRGSVSAMIVGDKARIEIDGSFYAPTSFRVITRDGLVTEYPKSYEGLGLREEAHEFARVVRAGEIESPLMTHQTSIELMEMMDSIRAQTGVKYPSE
ncbi:MAG: Gfo/Idh/MocA family oxidoreductase [Candidatus Planktophila sp.]|jgi:predicted dehydrogenase|nr:Gfo/Idh/MocA family oxidoreductase [Candidatus Planktophila sp.]MBP7903020.1 Gfo/Idh/MocA family oxidoreductase [Candidatus Planktophila sp.]